MDIYLLISIFTIIIIILFFLKKPLIIAILVGIISAIILYQIPLQEAIVTIFNSIKNPTTISVLSILYLITLLQRMMTKEQALIKAQQHFGQVSNHRRINTLIMPTLMGLLPSASAMYLAGDMVNESVKDELDTKEKAFVTSYYRHVFEIFLPTYGSVIIAVSLTNVNLGSFIIGTSPLVLLYIYLGYFFYLKKLAHNEHKVMNNKGFHLKMFLIYLSPIILILILNMIFNVPIYLATIIIIIAYALFNRYTINDLTFFIKDAFEPRILGTTLLIFIFKDIISYTGTIETLPVLFESISIAPFLIFGAIFFFGSIMLGNSAVYAIMLPIAFAAIPDAGMPLLVYLNALGFIAMQISPTHICLYIACEYFKIEMPDLIKKTAIVVFVFSFFTIFYYILLTNIL